MNELDLETLKYIKEIFELCNDESCNCLVYKKLCKEISEIEDSQFDNARILIEDLNVRRT